MYLTFLKNVLSAKDILHIGCTDFAFKKIMGMAVTVLQVSDFDTK